MWDRILIDGHAATLAPAPGTDPYGTIADAAVGLVGERIAWVGPRAALEAPPERLAREVVSMGGGWVTPGLVDCHTHLVFGGSRGDEFEARLEGASYAEIARRGGGIAATVRATRAADDDALLATARKRARALMDEGVTTVEIKSGYGLTVEDELRMLRVARRLADIEPIRVQTTLLGAHATPPEYADAPDGYVDLVCEEMIPAAAAERLADAVDAFCETIGFTPAQVERVFIAARHHGLRVKLHAEQLSDQGGAALAARYRALSADHLEHLGEAGVAAMAEAGTVAVLLPGAFHALNETKVPPVAALRTAGVPMAIATDCNPGSSPTTAMGLMMNLACLKFGLTPAEALAGTTHHAARALGLADRGRITPGLLADLALWDIDRPADLAYWVGGGRLKDVVFGGRLRSEGTTA
jgi:imidazolonepropionase